MRARFRGGPNVTPVGDDYSFATGGSGALGLWNYDFSVNLGATGLHISDVLANTTLSITDFLHGVTSTVGLSHWLDNASYSGSSGSPVIAQNGTGSILTALGEQNSENLGFGDSPLAGVYSNADNDVYRFTLTVRNNAGATLSSVTADVTTGTGTAVPEPMSLSVLGLGLAGTIAARRQRRKAA